MVEENEVAANKLAEENQVTTKEPQQVTTKNPKKVEAGRRLAKHNHRRREEKKREKALKGEGANQYYGIGAVMAVGVIGGLGYYIYQAKKGATSGEVPNNPLNQPSPRPQNNKFEMD